MTTRCAGIVESLNASMNEFGTSVSRISGNTLTGGVIAGFGLVTLFFLIPWGVVVPASLSPTAVSPAFWPRVTAMMLVIFGVLIVVRGMLQRRKIVTAPAFDVSVANRRRGALRIIGGFAVLYGSWASISVVGLPVASVLIIVILSMAFGERRAIWLIGIAIFLPLFLYVFFSEIAGVPIPLGIIWE